MPSPLGHALGGIIAGVLVHRAVGEASPGAEPARGVGSWRWPAPAAACAAWRAIPADVRLFAWLGMAADLDFFIGRHSRETHSIGATAIVGAGLWLFTRRPRVAASGAAAYASHILLDWLGSDTVPPIGIMALWPVTGDFYQSSLFVFDAISRRVLDWHAWVHNAGAVAREVVILAPILAVALAVWPGWKKLRPVAGR